MVEELGTTVRHTAEFVRWDKQLNLVAQQAASLAGHLAGQAIQTKQGFDPCVQRISGISRVIGAIAVRSTILALDAAVDAARASEQPCRFAVLFSHSLEPVKRGTQALILTKCTMKEIPSCLRHQSARMVVLFFASTRQKTAVSQSRVAVESVDQATENGANFVELRSAPKCLRLQVALSTADRVSHVLGIYSSRVDCTKVAKQTRSRQRRWSHAGGH